MPACPLLYPQGPAPFRGPELVSARLNQSGGDDAAGAEPRLEGKEDSEAGMLSQKYCQ